MTLSIVNLDSLMKNWPAGNLTRHSLVVQELGESGESSEASGEVIILGLLGNEQENTCYIDHTCKR